MKEIKEIITDFIKLNNNKETTFTNWRILNNKKDETLTNFVEKRFYQKFNNNSDYILNSYEILTENILKTHYQYENKSYYFLIELI